MDIPEIDVDELERHLEAGSAVYDVREDDEWEAAHIAGATLVPLSTVPDQLRTFPTDGPAYVICAKGARSARAVEFLRDRGVDAINVAGGMGAWLESGKPAVSGADG
ncbi:MAG: rhodanese-like domain-containing protein [Actinomycetota bacterium]